MSDEHWNFTFYRAFDKDNNSNLISENNNGSFINIEDLPAIELEKIVSYVNYVLKKNDEIVNVENKKQILKNNINENK